MKTVAVVGASANRRKFGNKALRAFREAGYRVIPINPSTRQSRVNAPMRRSLDYPGSIDIATVYVPPEVGEQLLEGLAAKGIAEVWFNPGSNPTRSSPGRGPSACDRSRRAASSGSA